MAGMGMGPGAIAQTIGGVAQHIQEFVGEMSPAAVAQRKEFRKAKDRLRLGTYGWSDAQKAGAAAGANQQTAATSAGQQADIARAQAGGQLAGGAATEAQRAVAQQALAANAQVAGQVQQASNAAAQAQYTADQGRVDQQAQIARDAWRRQGQISANTTNSIAGADTNPMMTPRAAPNNDSVYGARTRQSVPAYGSYGGV